MQFYHVVITNPKTSPKNHTLTVVEVQQLPGIEKTDSKDETSCLKWTLYSGRRKVCVNLKTDTGMLSIVLYRYRNNLHIKDKKIDMKLTEYQTLLTKREYLMGLIDFFSKLRIVLDETTVHNWIKFRQEWMILFLTSIFRLFLGLKLSLEHIIANKALFLSTFCCWDARLSSLELNHNLKIGRTFGYGDSYLDFMLCHSKVFRLHAILHDAVGAVV